MVLVVPFLVAACANKIPQSSDQYESNGQQKEQTSNVKPKVKTGSINTTASAPQAVLSLIERSQQLLGYENLKGAASSLERAIRISPRYPDSYYYLAKVRHLEGLNTQARALAKKSLSLGAEDVLLENILQLLDNIHESE